MKFSRISGTALLCAALFLTLTLQAEDIVGKITVVDVSGIGNQSSIEQLVATTIGTRVGQPLTPTQLSKDIGALIRTPGVADVQSTLDTLPDGRKNVTFLLKLKQNIVSKKCEGNHEFSNRLIMGLTKSAIGLPPDEITLAADRKAIVDKYEQEGFLGTEVAVRQSISEDGKGIDITYVIHEAKRYKLKGVAFIGNEAFTDSELQDVMLTRRPWWRYIVRLGNYYNEKYIPVDKDSIVALYATRGYLDCQVSKVELVPEEEGSEWITPTFTISEGSQYTFGKRGFSGNSLFTTETLEERCSLVSGEIYNSLQAEEDLSQMKALYEAQGYLDLEFYPLLRKNKDKALVDIDYTISEGEPSRIGRIIISGNEITRDRVIRRELTIFEDDLADERKIEQSKRRLENLGYFDSVEIIPKRSANPAQRDLNVKVNEKTTGSLSLGVGYSTEDSAMGFLELSETNFSLQRLLQFEVPKGDGQRVRAYVGIGSETQSANLSFTEPALFDSQFELSTEFFYNTRYEDEYDERSVGGALYLSWPIAFHIPFTGDHIEYWNVSAGIRIERFKICNISDEESITEEDYDDTTEWRYDKGMLYFISQEEGSKWANRFVLSLSRDTRNHFIFPNRGSRITLEAEYITKALGSYADYMKFHAGLETFLPVFDDVFMRIALNGDSIYHLNGDNVRIFDRYFAGGYGTVRGFKRNDLSPVNKNKNAIGGSTMICGTIEFIKPIKDFMFMKLFCDAGGVWWDEFECKPSEISASIGVGIQFRKLPIRLDYGYPIVKGCDYLEGRSGRLHFAIDYAF